MTSLPLTGIKRGSTDDGPGIRTTVFFKGCPLSCTWCHNPETVAAEPELSFAAGRCLGEACRACAGSCPAGNEALPPARPCAACGVCAQSCPTGARRLIGRAYPLTELTALLLKDRQFYFTSGGGVTLSGGEPTRHYRYAAALLQRLKGADIHTAIQTCGHFDIDVFRRTLLPAIDLVFFDLKLIDPEEHRRYTGLDNRLILDNFTRLAAEIGNRLVPRTPLVAGITATERNLAAIATLLRRSGMTNCELLPYNPGGIEKQQNLGRPAPSGLADHFMDRAEERAYTAFIREQLNPQTKATAD
jgi:pyruvate formate lyase activating enzyme